MEVESYKTQIIRTKSGSYFGELWVNNKLYQKTAYFANETIAISRLNKRIENFNTMNGTKIPPYQKDASTNQFRAELLESAEEHQPIPPTEKAEAEKSHLKKLSQKPQNHVVNPSRLTD